MVAMFAILLVCVVAFEFAIAAEVKALSSCGNRRQVVALTFDNRDIVVYDDTLMTVLREAEVKATFFEASRSTATTSDKMCSAVSKLHDEGHQIEVTTDWYTDLSNMQQTFLDEQIKQSKEFVKKCTGGQEPKYFQPPYGKLLPSQAQHISKKFDLVIATWNVDSGYANQITKFLGNGRTTRWTEQVIVPRITKTFEEIVFVGNSAVILMHAGVDPDVVKQVIRYFKGHGYTFVTVDQCYKSCNTPVCKGSGGPYGNIYVP